MSTETCPICQNQITWQKFLNVPDVTFKDTFTITQCPSCQVKRTIPVPEDLSPYYPAEYFNKPQSRIFKFAKEILIRWELRRVQRFTNLKSILDVGAGAGEFVTQAHRQGYRALAADNSPIRPYYIQSLPEISYQHFNYDPPHMTEPQLIKGRVVVLRHVLEHIKDPREFLNFFIKNQAGAFYIVVPNASCFERKIFRQYDSFWYPPYHLWHFNRHSLQTLLRGLGLEVVTTGFDTLPTIIPHVYFYTRAKKYPQWIQKSFFPSGAKVALTMPLNLFFPNNVVWAVARTPQSPPAKETLN